MITSISSIARRSLLAAVAIASALPGAAFATPVVTTESKVFVERAAEGNARALEPARSFKRGDRVVTILRWHRLGGDGGFTITNPLPRAIAYQASSAHEEEVSVDGGKTWGALESLRVGKRYATVEDVTHVRWRVSPGRSKKGSGQFAFSGIVR